MKLRLVISFHKQSILIALLMASASFAGPRQVTTIPVKLFGQACTLEGPYSDQVLQQVHSISPAEIPPFSSESVAMNALKKFDAARDIPVGLSNYRTQFRKLADAHARYFEALTEAKVTKKPERILDIVKAFAGQRNLNEFKMRLTVFLNKQTADAGDAALESLGTLLDARPEPEFHRVIQRLKIRYHCEFDHREEEEAPKKK